MAVFYLDQNYAQQSFALNEVRDYIDVAYNCKLCGYSSNSSDNIWHHVLEKHLNSPRSSKANGVTVSSRDCVQTCSDFSNVDPVSASLLNTSVHENTIPKLQSNVNEFESDDKSSRDAIRYNNDSPLASADELLERLNQEHMILTEALTVSAEEHFLTNFKTGNLTTSIPVINAKDPEVVVEFHRIDNKDTSVHEIFVCSSCRTGFTSTQMVENKSTMHEIHVKPVVRMVDYQNALTEHSSSLSAIPDSQIISTPNFTSTGTQVQLVKKPGRKRKVVSTRILSKQNSARSSCGGNNHVEIDTFDISIHKSMGNEHVSSNNDDASPLSSKRQIRPPRSLVKDYHIIHHRHWKRPSENVLKFKCMVEGCDAMFNRKDGLTYHSKCHTAENNSMFKFVCPECQKPFQVWIKLRTHLQVAHQVVVDWFYCNRCDFNSETASLLEEHTAAVHSGEVLSTTDKRETNHCPKESGGSAVKKFDLGLSMDTVCHICKRAFANRKSLLKHTEVVHEKLKTFICSMCGYSSARKATLQIHMRIHTGEKPFRCDVCVFSASDHNTLRRHRMRHTGQRSYSCSFCTYTCIQAASLKLHVRSKHPLAQPIPDAALSQTGTVVFACSSCPYQTVNQRSYQSHVTNHENAMLSSIDVIRDPKAAAGDLTSSVGVDPTVTCSASESGTEISNSSSYSVQFTEQFHPASSSKMFTVLSYQTVEANSNQQVFSVLAP